MRVAVERYFSSFNDLLDETNYLLTDWTTPQIDLANACKQKVYQRCLDIEKHKLSYQSPCLQQLFYEYRSNQKNINS